MNLQSELQAQIGEAKIRRAKSICPYVATCPLLVPCFGVEPEDIEERYRSVCSTDKKYGCSQFMMMGARE